MASGSVVVVRRPRRELAAVPGPAGAWPPTIRAAHTWSTTDMWREVTSLAHHGARPWSGGSLIARPPSTPKLRPIPGRRISAEVVRGTMAAGVSPSPPMAQMVRLRRDSRTQDPCNGVQQAAPTTPTPEDSLASECRHDGGACTRTSATRAVRLLHELQTSCRSDDAVRYGAAGVGRRRGRHKGASTS